MNDDILQYEKIHKIKLKMGILGALLIAGIFMGLYYGFMKTSLGYNSNGALTGYQIYQDSFDMDQDGGAELLIYTHRKLETRLERDYSFGTTNNNSIMIIDGIDGSVLWKYHLDIENYVVNHIKILNSQKVTYLDEEPLIFVQYSQVEDTINTLVQTEYDYKEVKWRNETKYYQSFIFNPNEEDPIVANLTDDIPDRVTKVFLLDYDTADSAADFMIQTVNVTYDDPQPIANPNNYFRIEAFKADGTLIWKQNSTHTDSILAGFYQNAYPNVAIEGCQLNKTLYSIASNDEKLFVFDLETGLSTWNKSYYQYSFSTVGSSQFDYNADDHPDLICYGYNTSTYSHDLLYINGMNGDILNDPVPVEGLKTNLFFLVKNPILDDLHNDYLVNFDDQDTNVNFYLSTEDGVILHKSYDFNKIDATNYLHITIDGYYNNSYGQFIKIRGQSASDDSQLVYLFNIDDKSVEFEANDIREDIVFCEINTEYGDLEYADVPEGERGYSYYTINSLSNIFLINGWNTSVFIVSLVLLTTSIVLMLKNRKDFRILLNEVSRNNEDLDKIGGPKRTLDSINSIRKIALTTLVILIVGTVSFIVFSFTDMVGSENVYGSIDYIAIRNVYVMMGVMIGSLTFISSMYNHLSSTSALVYIRIQRWFYEKVLKKSKDYKVVVLDMKYGTRYSPFIILQRSLFPIFVSLTVGLWVFQAFSSEEISSGTNVINLVWLSDFEIFGGLTFILTYIALVFIIPGGWLLDDSGVVYFEEPVDIKAPGDISKISAWLLNWLKGLFGVTAIVNYYNVFASLDLLNVFGDESLFVQIILTVLIFGILLIMSPILFGIITMFYSNTSMIGDLPYNRYLLFKKLEKLGIDTTPRNLRNFFIDDSNVNADHLTQSRAIESDFKLRKTENGDKGDTME